ncbi:uncharacterized protein LOC100371554 [Saccoglossus kowalevskii]|uniref:Uncharacterized protein LOC100371554 n=1 Tax=Saccoglossus kowalevskii TaxID=10224 RepID=A0ABM0GKN3_SACKO|nr:PREDICTED: uncharacterized protein LOC100371554 [Saccoglossus kowalevskii]
MGSRPSRNSNSADTVLRNESLLAENESLKYKITVLEKERNECVCNDETSLKSENETLRTENDQLTAQVLTLTRRIEQHASTTQVIRDRGYIEGSGLITSDDNEADRPQKNRAHKHKKTKHHYNSMQPMSDIDAYGQGLPPQQHKDMLKFGRSRKNSRKFLEKSSSNSTSPSENKESPEIVSHAEEKAEVGEPGKNTDDSHTVDNTVDHTKLVPDSRREKAISVDSGIETETREKDSTGNAEGKTQVERDSEPEEYQKKYIDLK